MEDYHSMKRKELQALCKKHNIPASSANSVLADKLSQLLNVQEKQKPITQQRACMKSQVETTVEGEPAVSKREAKKVRFSPSNDLFEYERSVKKQQDAVRETGARRKSVAKKVGKPVGDNDNRVELVDDAVQIPVKLTRSRVHILEKDNVVPNVGKRKGRSAVKDVKDVNEEPKANVGKTTRSKVYGSGKCGAVQLDENKQSKRPVKDDEKASKSVEEPVVVRARITRSKAQSSMDADMDPDVKPQVKKKSGRQVAKAAQLAEPAKEFVEIPVRTTRTRGQTLKEDIGNTVTKLQAEKKRTRKEMKATDQSSSNSTNVASEDNQELPKRKSLRTREVKVEDKDEGDKVQMIDNSRVTRSRVARSSKSKTMNKVEAQRKSKRVQQLEEPLERAVKKNVKRRESAMQPVKIEAVLHLEEPVDAPTGRVTRLKSIMQKAQGKGIDLGKTEVVHLEEPVSGSAGRITRRKSIMQKAQIKATDKPSIGKSEPVKETEIPDSPKTVGRNQSKRQCGSSSMIGEGLKDKVSVISSGKDAFEDKMKAAAKSTISPESKKRRGTPIIEDGPVEAKYLSPIESSRRSMRSASKSEGKSVTHPLQNSAKNQMQSGLKSSGGAVVRDGSSKKRAKLSVMKQSESEDHGEKSNIERTPISKLVTFELGERVVENEHTPAIDGSRRRFTRSAIGSNGKEPRQSAIKEQPIGDVQLSSHEVPKFRHDSAVKTAPGRVTRSGIKHARNVTSGLSERVDKKKQQSESAHLSKPFDDLQMSSHEVAEEPVVSVCVTVGTEESAGHFGDVKFTCDSVPSSQAFEQPGITSKSEGENDTEKAEEGERSSQKQVMQEPVSEDNNVPSREVSDGETNKDDTVVQLTTGDEIVSLSADEDDTKVDIVTAHDSSAKQNEPSMSKDISFGSGMDRHGIANDLVDTVKEPTQGLELEEVPSTIDVCEVPILGESDGEDHVPSGVEGEEADNAKKRAKSSVMKQSESEDNGEKSNIERTPISKLVTFELGGRVIDNEHTPAIDGSRRRLTRSAVGSNIKEPRQSAIKEQPIEDVQLSSHKVANFRHDLAVKTAPGRVTRSGIKHAGNVASCLSEMVDKKKQQCESAHQRKPFNDLQMSSHEVAESRLIPDMTIGADSEIPKVTDQILEQVGDISASESARLPAEVAKESKSETAITMESLSSLFDEEASGVESPINFEVETQPGTRFNVKTSSEAVPVAISDVSNGQNQAEYGKSAESVLKSGGSEAYEKELANLGSPSKGLQNDVGAEEPVVSVCVTVGTEESSGHFGDVNFTCDSVLYSQAFEQPGIKSKSEGEDDIAKSEEGDMPNREVSDELDGETNKDDAVVQLTAGDEIVSLSADEDDTKVDTITAHDCLSKQNEPSMAKNISFGPGMDRHGVANDLVDTVKEPTQGLELEAVPSTVDVCEVPILGESDGVGGNMPFHGEDHVLSSVEGEDEADKANSEYESNPKPLTDDNVSRLSEPMTDSFSANDIHETPLSSKDSSFGLATERRGVEDNLVDAEKEPEFEVAPSTANDVNKMPSLGKPDGVDGGVNATRESDGEDLVLSSEDGGDDADKTYKEHESNSKPLINDDTSVLGKEDYVNITRLFEPTLDRSSANDIVETPNSGNDIAMDRSGVADTGKEHAQEPEFVLAPSAGNDVQEILGLGESDSANATKERETDSVPSTGGNVPSDGEHLVLCGGDGEDQAYNTNKEHESKLKQLTDDDVSDTSVLGKDDDYNITGLCEPTSDPSTNDVVETPFSVNYIFGESDNAIYDQKSPPKPITDNEDGFNNGPKDLESGFEPSVTSYSPNVLVLGNNADRNGQDGGDVCGMGQQFVGGVGSESDQNENMPAVTEDLIRSTMAVDAREESLQDVDKDAVSDYFGDIYGLENAVGVTDTENDNWNEQKVTRTSEPDESAFSKVSDSISPDMNPEQITEEAELTTESDHALSDKKEMPGTTIEHNLGSGKSMEDCSNSAVEILDSHNIKVQETPTREEIPVGDTLSDAPTSLKEDIGHKQEKTQKENMFVDWGNYSSRMDGFQKLVLANKNDDLPSKSTKDDQVSDLQSSARASSSIQESSCLAADFVNSANKLENSSRNATDRESDQDVDLLKGNANMLEEDFNWSDLSLKSLFTTPAATRNDLKGENTPGNATGQENEMCGVTNFEHFSNKYFEDEEVDGSIDWSGKNKHIELKGDQYDLSSEAASTGNHLESSGLHVSSTCSGAIGEKETQLKGSETGANLTFDKGT